MYWLSIIRSRSPLALELLLMWSERLSLPRKMRSVQQEQSAHSEWREGTSRRKFKEILPNGSDRALLCTLKTVCTTASKLSTNILLERRLSLATMMFISLMMLKKYDCVVCLHQYPKHFYVNMGYILFGDSQSVI